MDFNTAGTKARFGDVMTLPTFFKSLAASLEVNLGTILSRCDVET